MNIREELLKEIVEDEKNKGFYEPTFCRIPLYYIIRNDLRKRRISLILKQKEPRSLKDFKLSTFLISFIDSAKQFLSLVLKPGKVDNVILCFPRIEKVDDFYVDKFVDPLLMFSNLNNSTICFQRGIKGHHPTPRLYPEKLIKTEFVDVCSQVLGILFTPLVFLFNIKKLMLFYRKTNSYFFLSFLGLLKITFKLSEFLFKASILKNLFERLRAKRFLGVAINHHLPYIISAKKNNMTVYELQHGVTFGETILYSGFYNPNVHPDFFLAFGDLSLRSVYGVPINRIIITGWAFNKLLEQKIRCKKFGNNIFLVISGPEVTSKILEASLYLAKHYPEFEFHVRLHPMEIMTNHQHNIIEQTKNLKLQDNKINSNVTLLSYRTILGENSTVLYEALSIGKKVGFLKLNGLNPIPLPGIKIDPSSVIRNLNDFAIFIQNENLTNQNNTTSIYSEFNPDSINRILENN